MNCNSGWDVEHCVGTSRRKFNLKPAKIPYITMWQHWLGIAKPEKAFRLILNAFKKVAIDFFLTEFSTD